MGKECEQCIRALIGIITNLHSAEKYIDKGDIEFADSNLKVAKLFVDDLRRLGCISEDNAKDIEDFIDYTIKAKDKKSKEIRLMGTISVVSNQIPNIAKYCQKE